MELSTREIRTTRIIGEPPHRAWARWTTHEGLTSFFGRDNAVDLELGGRFEIYFLLDNPPGLRGSEGCKVLSFLPERMLSFSWNAPPAFKEVREADYKTWVVVLFTPLGADRTDVSLSHVGWPKDVRWDPVYEYFQEAWEEVLSGLEACSMPERPSGD
ncbi:MAG TPA: SRPBCC domain-containing protein [Rectinemataceae bacterium]|nr:SRPBCC domain-containing protein [Rectinemataceae bacterium]